MLSKEYIAGLFDGEGCVNITISGKNRQATLRVMIVNTNRSILELVQSQYGGQIYEMYGPRTHPKWKQSWQLRLFRSYALNLLKDIRPFVYIKTNQIELAIMFEEFMDSPDRLEGFKNSYGSISHRRTTKTIEKENAFKMAMSELNMKGPVHLALG